METIGRQATSADYRDLTTRIRALGLLEKRPIYYSAKVTLTLAVYIALWSVFVVVGNDWATLFCAIGLALLFAQVVFIGHDAGHSQISTSRRINRLVGMVTGNLLTGVSYGWWVPKHSAHHAHPNQVGRDPDIGPGVLAFSFTAEEAGRQHGTGRWITRNQAWLFVPLLILEGIGLHITSADWLARRRDRAAFLESALLVAHVTLYATVVFSVLSPLRAVAFIAVQQGVFGLYLGCSFAPNHKAMPVLEADSQLTFATRQVITARNVEGGPVLDFLLGGLNHQIEHHLFPAMCRPNLAKARGLVREFCTEHGLPYCEIGLIQSYRLTVRHLWAVSRAASR